MPEEELKNMARMIDLNRQRLEQLQDQVSRLEIVQVEAGDVETSLLAMSRLSNAAESAQSDKKENKVMIPIGSGVHLPTTVDANTTAVIDIGSGIFAEKNSDDAAEIIRTRIIDLGIIITQLNVEAETITEKINEMSAEFNLAAQKMTGSGAAEVGVTIPPFSEDNSTESTTEGGKDTISDQKKQPKTARRRGFGGELTLDD